MALHCAATLLVVDAGRGPALVEPGLSATHGPWPAGADVVAELQHVADQHRGERVLVTLAPGGLATVLRHLGRVAAPGGGEDRLWLEVGDDGWTVLPWPASSCTDPAAGRAASA